MRCGCAPVAEGVALARHDTAGGVLTRTAALYHEPCMGGRAASLGVHSSASAAHMHAVAAGIISGAA